MTQPLTYRVGVDIGGTFTDIVLLGSDGSVATLKLSSTTDDYGRGIVDSLRELIAKRLPPEALAEIVHGTTVATNAILESKGARTALITTEGFRDVLEFRRIRIPQLYNLFYEKPPPLVPRRLRFEVQERIGPRGEVWEPLQPESVTAAVERLRAANVEAVAITFLHSYANPAHERAVQEVVQAALPEVYVSCSVEILPEIREYERTSTTVINAYVGPIVKHYLSRLIAELRSINPTTRLLIMQSNGGVMSAESAIERPAQIVESGPAAGVIAAARTAKRAGYPNVISFDMGGTTAKASLVEDGKHTETSEYEVGGGINLSSQLVKGGGYALKLPVIDISEIGAGGGSIVWVDPGGRIRIGPRSAGAVPGPACYLAGGEEPTLTDANVVLGYINPAYLAGGRIRLDAERAAQALSDKVAARTGMSLLDTAYGVYRIAGATMTRAIKAVSTYRGRDPRDFALLAFGGSGPICAVELARSLQIRQVLIPPAPGLFSAFGLLISDREHQFAQTYFRRAAEAQPEDLNAAYARLERQARRALEHEGYRPEQITMHRAMDLRYAGQAYELIVPIPAGPLTVAEISNAVEAFEQEHFRTYGHRAIDEPVDVVNVRVSGLVPTASLAEYAPFAVQNSSDPARPFCRDAYFGPEHGILSTPVLTRPDLQGAKRAGPLIVEEYDATCVVPPDAEASLDPFGNIVIDVG